jgi:hypothetical protein
MGKLTAMPREGEMLRAINRFARIDSIFARLDSPSPRDNNFHRKSAYCAGGRMVRLGKFSGKTLSKDASRMRGALEGS